MVPAAIPQSQSTNPTDGASVVVTFTNAGANTTQADALSCQRHARDLSPRCTRHNAATRGLGPHTRQAGDLTGQETNSCAGMGSWW